MNNDYHRLTNYLEVDFKPFQKPDAPDLYPEELREEIDKLNWWLFENVNNAVYRAQFAQSLQAFQMLMRHFCRVRCNGRTFRTAEISVWRLRDRQ